jgi:hypothetical protein
MVTLISRSADLQAGTCRAKARRWSFYIFGGGGTRVCRGKLGLPGTRRLAGPKSRPIIALGNAKGIESALQKRALKGRPKTPSRWHALSGRQLYKENHAFNPGRLVPQGGTVIDRRFAAQNVETSVPGPALQSTWAPAQEGKDSCSRRHNSAGLFS